MAGVLWKTKSDGLFRVVRLIHRCAFKTPHILNRKAVEERLETAGHSRRKTLNRVAMENVVQSIPRELFCE